MTEQTNKGLKDRLDGETSGFFIAAIATAPPTWTIAFNFGAFHTVFYNHLFTIWAASIAMFLASLVLSSRKNPGIPFGWWSILLLILPSIWMVFDILAIDTSSGLVTAVSVILMVAVVFLSVPFIVWYLQITFFQALTLDVSISLFFVLYTFVFNWAYDLLFPIPISRMKT